MRGLLLAIAGVSIGLAVASIYELCAAVSDGDWLLYAIRFLGVVLFALFGMASLCAAKTVRLRAAAKSSASPVAPSHRGGQQPANGCSCLACSTVKAFPLQRHAMLIGAAAAIRSGGAKAVHYTEEIPVAAADGEVSLGAVTVVVIDDALFRRAVEPVLQREASL